MQQLECRFYPRQEIAEALSVNPKDSKHFAERVKTTLDKWGYEYEYSRSGVEITGKPETAEERLREILIRKLNLDVQIDAYAFACFICAFTDIGSFDSMPWEERAELMKYKYGVDVSDRTLRNWCSKLISSNIIQKCGKQTYWKTEIYGKEKYRSNVDPDDEDMARYFQMKSKYLEETRKVQRTLNCGSRRPPRGVLLTKSCGGSSNAAIIPAMVWCSMQSEKTTFLKSTNWHRRLPLHLPFPFQSKEK